MSAATDPVSTLRRWEDSGGIWRVIGGHAAGQDNELTVSLCQCTGGEEVERVVSTDPALRAYVAGRLSSLD